MPTQTQPSIPARGSANNSANKIAYTIDVQRVADSRDSGDDCDAQQIHKSTGMEINTANAEDQEAEHPVESPTSLKNSGEFINYGGIPYVKPECFMDIPLEIREKIYHSTPTLNHDNSELFDILSPLVVTAGRQRFRITAEENKLLQERLEWPETGSITLRAESYQDPLVNFINTAAAMGLGDSPPQPDLPRSVAVQVEHDGCCGLSRTYPKCFGKIPFERVGYPQSEYSLIPECRKCYAMFREQIDLDVHLAQNPKHKVPFVKKRYNELYKRSATIDVTKHKCRVCENSFDSLVKFDKHCEKFKHTRTREHGIVGRWKQDNGWYKYPSRPSYKRWQRDHQMESV
jgi:hypothetical protein